MGSGASYPTTEETEVSLAEAEEKFIEKFAWEESKGAGVKRKRCGECDG